MFEKVIERVQSKPPKGVAVAVAEDYEVLRCVLEARSLGFVMPILVGNRERIEAAAGGQGLPLEGCEIIEEGNSVAAAEKAVALCRQGKAEILMKGQLHSDVLMKAILDKENGIREKSLLSMVTILYVKHMERFLFITDGGMVIAPNLKEKVIIIENAVSLARKMGVTCPKVACLAAVETVNPAMPATLDGAALAVMSQRGQFLDCIVDGPLALDNAVDPEAVRRKEVCSPVPVAGNADILLVPDIEAGNILLKSSRQFGGCQTAGLVVGASVPIVMTSRADSYKNKLRALACAAYEWGE